jgi:hypothetical protein
MDPASDPNEVDIKLDPNDLYREESYTDRRVGSIRCMVPVKSDGSEDNGRKKLFMGHTQLWSQMGPIPITFEIEADDLDQAIEAFPAAAQEGIQNTLREAEEMRRQQESQIVVPGADSASPIQLR